MGSDLSQPDRAAKLQALRERIRKRKAADDAHPRPPPSPDDYVPPTYDEDYFMFSEWIENNG